MDKLKIALSTIMEEDRDSVPPTQAERDGLSIEFASVSELFEEYSLASLDCEESLPDHDAESSKAVSARFKKITTGFYQVCSIVRNRRPVGPPLSAGTASSSGGASGRFAKQPKMLSAKATPLEFEGWKDDFADYLRLSQVTKIEDQRSMLQSCLDSTLKKHLKGLAVATLPITGPASCISVLDERFQMGNPLLSRRIAFFTCKQNSGESMTAFRDRVDALADLAELDKFTPEDMRVYTILLGTTDDKYDIPITPLHVNTARPVPIHMDKAAKELTGKLIDGKILKPVFEPTEWCSPGHFVLKANGVDVRIVTDMRVLNGFVKRPVHPFIPPRGPMLLLAPLRPTLRTNAPGPIEDLVMIWHDPNAPWRISDSNSQRAHRQNTLRKNLNRACRAFFLPPANVRPKVRQVTDRLLRILQHPSGKFKVDRCAPGGSYGKHTDTCLKVDLDIVVFISTKPKTLAASGFDRDADLLGMKEEIFAVWRQDLGRELGLAESDFSGKAALTFFYEGIEIDLLPAPSYAQSTKEHSKIVFDKMATQSSKTGSRYSTTLAEIGIAFVREQPAIVKDLCRLTKFWQNGVHIEKYVDGRSFIFECIAIYVWRSLSESDQNNILYAFCSFLECLKVLPSVRIDFPECYQEYVDTERYEFVQLLHDQRPGLYLPNNPFGNILAVDESMFHDTFASAADQTLLAIMDYTNGGQEFSYSKIMKPWGMSVDHLEGDMFHTIIRYDPGMNLDLPKAQKNDPTVSLKKTKQIMKHYATFIYLKQLDIQEKFCSGALSSKAQKNDPTVSLKKTKQIMKHYATFIYLKQLDIQEKFCSGALSSKVFVAMSSMDREDNEAQHRKRALQFQIPERNDGLMGGFSISFDGVTSDP
eukprot:snap_masked-scaffold658_size117954-processed-gene-0.13 protein:Tk06736 transcript:snap_masked-scaffold658_size117954-processed-gene-0.13-mRNA-1 annotation:"2 -5 -oligoadenylate synthase 3-like"